MKDNDPYHRFPSSWPGKKKIPFVTTHHRVSDSEDWDLRMLFSHQLDVIEDVIDVFFDRLDVNAMAIAHSVSNCVDSQQKNRKKRATFRLDMIETATTKKISRLCPAQRHANQILFFAFWPCSRLHQVKRRMRVPQITRHRSGKGGRRE